MKRALKKVFSRAMMPLGAGFRKAAIAAVMAGQAACLCWGGSGTWSNPASGGLWSSGGNWSSGAIADGSGFTADFSTLDLEADNTVHLDGPRTLGYLQFGDTSTNTAAGWTLDNNGSDANVLTLAGTVPTLTVNALGGSSGVTLSAILAGAAGLTKAGPGTLTLTCTNTYTGATAVSNGTLALSGSGALVTNTAITINGGTLDMGSQNATNYLGNNTGVVFGSNGGNLNGTGTFTILGQSQGATALTVPASASATVNENIVIANTNIASTGYGELANVGAGGTLTINGKVKGYSSGNGNWMKGGGTLVLNNPSNQMSTMSFWGSAGTISTPYFSALGSVMVMGQSASHGAATFIYTGVATNTALYFTPASLAAAILNNGSGPITFTGGSFTAPYGTPASATTQRLTLGGSSDMTISGKIQNANGSSYLTAVVKTNANTVTLAAANTYSGGTTIAGGTLQLGDGTSGRDGTVLGSILNNAALVYNLYSTQTVGNVISGSGSVTKTGGGTLTLASENSYAGVTTISGGTLRLGSPSAITNTGAINVAGGTYDLGGFSVTNGAVTLSAGQIANGTLAGSSLAYTDAGLVTACLAGTGTVTKSGPGTLVLRGANSFTGPLVISGGAVELQASPAAGSAVWLDAASIASMAKNTDGSGGVPAAGDGVGRWTSLSGSNWVSSSSKPTYQTNVLNGLPILRFAGGIPFMSNVVAQGSTVFVVYKQTGSLGNWLQPLDSQGQTPSSGWLHMINSANQRCLTRGGGAVSVGSTFPSTNWAVQVVQLQTNNYRLWVNESAYGPSTATNEFTAFTHLGIPGDFAEVIIYTNLLSAADRTTTISYLQKKWLGVSSTSAVTNSLSSTLAAEVRTGAVLDLCGGSQTLAALSGGGRVTNGAVTVTGRLSPGDSGAAAGVLTVGGDLTLTAGATNAFDCVAGAADTVSVSGTLTLQGANTVEVSLNGQPPPAQMTLFTFSALAGEGYLSSWTVQGSGLDPYGKRVARVGNSVVLYMYRLGTLISVR